MDVTNKENTQINNSETRKSNALNEEDPQPPISLQVESQPPSCANMDFSNMQDIQNMDPETESRLRAFLEVAGVKLSHVDARTFQDPEILRKLTNRFIYQGIHFVI